MEELLNSGANKVIKVLDEGTGVLTVVKQFPLCGFRDRLMSEAKFLSLDDPQTPMLLSIKDESTIVTEFIPGVRPKAEDIDENHILQCAHFYRRLRAHDSSYDLWASEPFIDPSFYLHDQAVRRVYKLRNAPCFDRLVRLYGWLAKRYAAEGRYTLLPPRLSPGDFGFHNTIRLPGGSLFFVDFEHAGLDHPAKTINDFFLSPAVPIPPKYRRVFIDTVLAGDPQRDLIEEMIVLTEPLFIFHWALIILNPFVASYQRRVLTSHPDKDIMTLQAERNARAEGYLDRLEDSL